MDRRPKLGPAILEFMDGKKHEYSWFRKVSLYSVFEDWSPETIGRTLRQLAEDGKLEVSYYDGRYSSGLAKYKLV